jgi:hypothetical protein
MFQNQIKMRLTVLLACLLFAAWPAAMAQSKAKKPSAPSAPPKCDCQHIPALKQDIDDSKWLAQAFANKAAELEAKEIPLYRRLARLAGDSDEMTALWNDFNTWAKKTLRVEFKKARGYEDTTSVDFDEDTNKPDPKQLEAALQQAPCLRIAEAIKRHEDRHSALRKPGRGLHERPSQLALEEKAQYEDGVAFVQEEVDSLEKNCGYGWHGTVSYSRTTFSNEPERSIQNQNFNLQTDVFKSESNSSYTVEITISGGKPFSGFALLQSTATVTTSSREASREYKTDRGPCGFKPNFFECTTTKTINSSGTAKQELRGSISVKEDGSYLIQFNALRDVVEDGKKIDVCKSTGWCNPENGKRYNYNRSQSITAKRRFDEYRGGGGNLAGFSIKGRLDPNDPGNLDDTWSKKEQHPTPGTPGNESREETVITWKIQRHLAPGS